MSQVNALELSVERAGEIARALAPAFIELTRAIPQSFVAPTRPGLATVSELIGRLLVASAQVNVLKNLLVESELLTDAVFQNRLAVELEAQNASYANALNTKSPDSFAFKESPP